MLAKHLRLSKREHGASLAELRASTAFFLVRAKKIDAAPESRYAIVVSQKVIAKATKRNRSKRRLWAALGTMTQSVRGGYAVVFTIRRDPGALPFPALIAQARAALTRISLLR